MRSQNRTGQPSFGAVARQLCLLLIVGLLGGCAAAPSDRQEMQNVQAFIDLDSTTIIRGRDVPSPGLPNNFLLRARPSPSGRSGSVKPAEYPYPYLVALLVRYGGKDNYQCTGVLVARDWVLTAAHCTYFPSSRACPGLTSGKCFIDLAEHYQMISVVVGSAKVPNSSSQFLINGDRVGVDSVKRASVDFDPNRHYPLYANDLALLHLQEFVNAPADIVEIAAADRAGQAFQSPLRMLGWGPTTTSELQSDVLQYGDLAFDGDDACKQSPIKEDIAPNSRCVANRSTDPETCKGDSGGPLLAGNRDDGWLYDPVIVGVVSWGTPCGFGTHVDVFQLTAPYRQWIHTTIGRTVPIS